MLSSFSKKIKCPAPSFLQLPIAWLVFLALGLIFFFPVIFQGKTFYAFDCLLEYLPWASLAPGFRAHNSLLTDPLNALYPSLFYLTHHYYQESMANGSLTLWFNLNFCGVPFALYSYPLLYIFYTLFPLLVAHDLLLFVHLLGTGILTYLYLKEIGLRVLPSTIGGIAWMFNGYVMVWFEFEHIPMMALTLPASLYFIELWWRQKSLLSFLGLTCAIALSICAGYAHVLVYQLFFVGIYLLYRCFSDKNKKRLPWKQTSRTLQGAILAIIIALIISANFFITHLMIYRNSQRQPIPYSDFSKKTGQLPPKYLSTILFPDLFGSPVLELCFTPVTKEPQPYNNYNELCIYPGILTIFLGLASIPYWRKKKYIGFFTISTLLSLSMAMSSILYYPLARLVPGLNLSTPTRILYLFGFSVSVLAALGADLIQSKKNRANLPIILLWTLVVAPALIITFFVQTEEGMQWAVGTGQWSNWKPIMEVLHAHLAISSNIILKPLLLIMASFLILTFALYSPSERYKSLLLSLGIILLSYDLISFGHFYNTASPKHLEFPSTPAIRFLKKDKAKFRIITFGHFLHNSFAPFGIEDIGGYASFYPRRYGEFLYISQKGLDAPLPRNFNRGILFERFGSPLLDLINTKYVLASPSTTISSKQLKLVYSREIKIYENLYAFPRIFFVPNYYLAESPQDAYQILGQFSREDFSRKVILESPPPAYWQQNNKAAPKIGINSKVQIISYEPDRVEIDVSTDQKGFIVIGDDYHPGWQAKVDGKETNILHANYIMRAIPVKEGKHKIILTFRSKLLMAGLIITAGGWIVIFGTIAMCIIKKIWRKKTRKEQNKT